MNFSSIFSVAILLSYGSDIWATPIISEFMAVNRSTVVDEDGDRSDWVELFNPSNSSVKLKGWALTDDPTHQTKWAFPNVTLSSREYRIVFASGKNRTGLNTPLHTDFQLSREPGYLALLDANGLVAYEFSSKYPEQFEDISFGKGNTKRDEVILLREKSAARALVPKTSSAGTGWKNLEFNDSSWKKGKTGVGYDYGSRIGLNVGEMRNSTESVYIRVPFKVPNLSQIEEVVLRLKYEDGFTAFINGKKIASDNAPSSLNWKSGAPENRPDSIATTPVEFNIVGFEKIMKTGDNILAIQGLNNKVTSSDLLIHPEIVAYKTTEVKESFGFMFQPSPGERNNDTVRSVEAEVVFKQSSQLFQTSLQVELSKPDAANPNLNIHYTTDGSIPNGSSPVYNAKLTISNTTLVKARLVHPNGGMGPVSTERYFEIQRNLTNASSNLPYLILENFGGGKPPSGDYQTASMAIIEPSNGRSRFKNEISMASQVGIKVRGSSTAGRSKMSLSLEVQDEFGQDKNLPLLGMPSESDWVLWGPYNFDLTLMHNPFIFELSRQIGRYAPRTQFIEVYLNTGGGALSAGDYYGVYALMEKIDRDADRVDVEKLFPEHRNSPEVSGGYILKIDRADPGDSGFGAAGQNIKHVYPKEVDIEQPGRDAQQQYLRRFFNEMGTALNASYFKDPKRGYAKYIDVEAAIDHHLLNVVAFNVDALRLSGYMHIPRNGKLTFGPIWDFDRALGSTDGRDNNPRTWRSTSGDRGTDFFNYPWWNRMFRDIDFFQKYIDRFQSLRGAEFSKANINAIIDGMAGELKEAQKRNLAKWNQRPRSQYGGTYQGEVNHMKTWLAQRISFMEKQFVDLPESTQPTGYIRPNTFVSLKSKEGGKIYYTLNGTDPRRSGGSVSANAIHYTGEPLQINKSTLLAARVYKTTHRGLTGSNNPPLSSKWSGLLRQYYSIMPSPNAGDLTINELHYHPIDPTPEEVAVDPTFRASDFEFIELLNASDQPFNLIGLTVAGEIRFTFASEADEILEPGQRLLLVSNARAFALRYGSEPEIKGVYAGKLSNGSGRIEIANPVGKSIFKMNYMDDWHPTTDGQGYSLVANQALPPGTDSEAAHWRPSLDMHGSPGKTDERITLRITDINPTDNGIELLFTLPTSRKVVVQYTDSLGQADWQSLKTIQTNDESKVARAIDSTWTSKTERFYRLLLQ